LPSRTNVSLFGSELLAAVPDLVISLWTSLALAAATLVLLVRNFAVRAPTPAHLSCAREASRAHDS
jgi:hypothetical protein